ncbi:hypothetical protein H2200_007931 [Cladophialophora chaetospira]|uniref:Trichothecene 3-O-acetyltransferase-like N-terminal domain-containing protein n=1 Tax=Cladophialophora chaetospira TaxID=386627 RepID=A0AA38X6P5_9EURO|nr:hypothetical protein H2200_007931 [Cladophialophora chaetospira]
MATYTARLSPVDQFFPLVYTTVWLCIPASDPSRTITALQSGLAKTIEQLPFLKGTVSLDQEQNYSGITWTDGPSTIILEKIEGNFPAWAELDAQGMPLHRLQAHNFLPAALQGPYFLKPTLPAAAFSYAQLDQGLIVTVAVHHHVMDGDAMTYLFDIWAAHTSGRPFTGVNIDPHEPLGRYERFVQAFQDSPIEGDGKILSPTADFATPPASGPPQRPTYKPDSRIFSFDSVKLGILRKALFEGEGFSSTLSKNTIVCALLWYFINKARLARLPEAAGQGSSSLMVTSNMRPLLKHKALAAGEGQPYIGNLVISAPATLDMSFFALTPAAHPAADFPQLLPMLIGIIRRALSTVTVPKLAAAVKTALEIPDARSCRNIGDLLAGRNIVTTTWANLAFWSDFGEQVGKPSYVRIPGTGFDGLATVLPLRRHVLGDQAPLEVIAVSREEDIATLEADESLGAWLTQKPF